VNRGCLRGVQGVYQGCVRGAVWLRYTTEKSGVSKPNRPNRFTPPPPPPWPDHLRPHICSLCADLALHLTAR